MKLLRGAAGYAHSADPRRYRSPQSSNATQRRNDKAFRRGPHLRARLGRRLTGLTSVLSTRVFGRTPSVKNGIGTAALLISATNIIWGRFLRSAVIGDGTSRLASGWTSVVFWSDSSCIRQGVPLHNTTGSVSCPPVHLCCDTCCFLHERCGVEFVPLCSEVTTTRQQGSPPPEIYHSPRCVFSITRRYHGHLTETVALPPSNTPIAKTVTHNPAVEND